MTAFPAFLNDLDSQVFTILTALSSSDKASFLRIQRILREKIGSYVYLEIGSEMGGSLIPHLLDPMCLSAVSIDLRPNRMPDERGTYFDYPDNSTAKMRRTLAAHVGETILGKLTTFDSDASEITTNSLPSLVDLAMIDGEHTTTACFSDFVSVLGFVKPDAVVAFHDSNLVADAIQNCERLLDYLQIPYSTAFLPDCVAVIGLRGMSRIVEELRPHAHERVGYLERSRKGRWLAVAHSMIESGEFSELQTADTRLAASLAHSKDLGVELNAMNEMLKACQDRLVNRDVRIGEVQARFDSAIQRVAALESSSSWKITAPLRALAKKLGR